MTEQQERALFDAHYAELERVYGRDRASRANIGWGWAEGSLASKVYGKRPYVCTTTYDEETGAVLCHTHNPY